MRNIPSIIPVAILALYALALPGCATSPATTPGSGASDELAELIAQHRAYQLREFPTLATRAGMTDYNDRLGSVSAATLQRQREFESVLLAQLGQLPRNELEHADLINAELLDWVLRDSLAAHELDLARIPLNTFWGFYMGALRASDGVRMESAEAYRQYIDRIRDFPRWFDENITNMQRGIETGFTLPRIVVEGVLPGVLAQVKDDPAQSSLYQPFETMSERLAAAEQEQLRSAAREAIATAAMPAFARLHEFMSKDYLAAATATVGASAMNGGADYYRFAIRRYVTADMDPDEIHRIGLAEVARIRNEMRQVIDELGFTGSFDEFTEFLRTDPGFYASSPEELLKEASWIAKRIDYVMPRFFGKLPRLPYGIVPVPDEIAPNYTTASYNPAPLGGVRGGAYWLNTYRLDQRPLYELTALTLHEAAPGHHHQGALSQELDDVPEFRRNLYLSAFGEGWGLYAEKLGIEMGVYQTPYDHFGRLSYEMWRACRLVIDTGIHSQGWSRQQGLDYLAQNTSLSQANVRAEVDRYISWPGQALSYKLGELKILELRRRAEQALGGSFDLREFHDTLLGNGALPLVMLEAEIDRWIAAQQQGADVGG
ncbi:MAG: DUF885 domain-containing protein [Gammaproteobacteria bacterium]|nr:DUF885 domain-containing protein [Gammaproteobacteria bacterium]NNM20790.1 DUF885 domain-containing protein [Gammaproteobacteria bacterium]